MSPENVVPPPDPARIDLQRVLADPDPGGTHPRRNLMPRNDPPEEVTLDEAVFRVAQPALETQAPLTVAFPIRNTDRSVGARLAGEIARRFGDTGLPGYTIRCSFRGSAGQSFGAFCVNGLCLELTGEANDYVGKGMTGGDIIVRFPPLARYASNENYILGNTVLYGATGGVLLAAGRAGERFAVRNSGALAVVEGIGDHGCEYMTGGAVVVLGPTGRNFGAGMTGGVAFVLDTDHNFVPRLNEELVGAERLAEAEDLLRLRDLVERHAAATASAWGRQLLARWDETWAHFWKILPR